MDRHDTFSAARLIVALIMLSLSQAPVRAQTAPTPAPRADELFRAGKWAEAAAAYEAAVKAKPDDAAAWYGLASALYRLGQFAPAAEAFLKNVSLTKSPTAMFNLACVYSRAGEKDRAVEWLGRAFAPENKALYFLDLNDPDLSPLRDDPRYRALALSVDKLKNPCMYSAEARQLDFWVGEWEVFDPRGRKSGTSVIERVANGCGVLENWTSAAGGSGKSINFYDPRARKWFQYWIGADGNPARYSGVYRDGALRYEGEPFTQNGKTVITRLTFFDVDAVTVRQLSERSEDGGRTWSVGYDFKYVRRGAANRAPSSR